MLELFCFLLSAAATASITIFCGICNETADLWKPVLLFVAFFIGFLLLFFATLFAVSLCFDKNKEVKNPSAVCVFIFKVVLAFIMRYSGAKVKAVGRELVPQKNAVWVLNHRSNFDPMVLANEYKFDKMIMISKPENFNIPILGGFIHKMGYLSIDRNNDREALKTVLKAIRRVKEGYSLTVFPEGTRNKTEENLLPFRSGVFKIATQAGVPIVVATVYGTEKIHKNFPFKKTAVNLDVLAVITPEEYKGLQSHEISDTVSKIMDEKIQEYKKQL